MKFKIDENLPTEMAGLLGEEGYSALTVLDQSLGGKIDSTIARVCRDEDRAIVTLDLDFSDIRSYPPEDYPGIIVLRPLNQSKKALMNLSTGASSSKNRTFKGVSLDC